MNFFVILIISAIVGVGATLAGLNPLQEPIYTDTPGTAEDRRCLDYNPPDKTQQVTFQGKKYSLIKKKARVPGPNPRQGEEDKFNLAMTEDLGSISEDNNRKVRKLDLPNFFGQPVESFELIIYVYRPGVNGDQRNGSTFFDIYIEENEKLSDPKYEFILKCKFTGGAIPVVINEEAYPPFGFNTNPDDGGPKINRNPSYTATLAPAYVRPNAVADFTKAQFDAINPDDIKDLGTLEVKKNGSMVTKPLKHHLGGVIYLIDEDDGKAYAYTNVNDGQKINFSTGRDKDSLQIEKLQMVSSPLYTWYTPECKPAIYLYPEKAQEVHVRVTPKGEFTYTDPIYPDGGWRVLAYPDGRIESNGKIYPYLYYESHIDDQFINKPSEGFLVRFTELKKFFDNTLPGLGLNEQETRDFSEYWVRTLPYFNYYFVGIMKLEDIERIEPLSVTPEPAQMIRVRTYFEGLEFPKVFNTPKISYVKRVDRGLSVVEWGGMVKMQDGSKFTCSQ